MTWAELRRLPNGCFPKITPMTGTWVLPRPEINSVPNTRLTQLFPRRGIQSGFPSSLYGVYHCRLWPWDGILQWLARDKVIEDHADFCEESESQPPKSFTMWITKHKNCEMKGSKGDAWSLYLIEKWAVFLGIFSSFHHSLAVIRTVLSATAGIAYNVSATPPPANLTSFSCW